MSERIQTRRDEEARDDRNFDMLFPMLVLSLRDFTLGPRSNGQEMTSDQYMEKWLVVKPKTGPEVDTYNRHIRNIKKCFRRRHCFKFDRPAPTETLKNLASLPDSDSSGLLPRFVTDVEKFAKFIYEKVPTKKLLDRQPINGRSEWILDQILLQCPCLIKIHQTLSYFFLIL